ncbi:hypothetical protein FKP32DRAFT_259967 [Trametes sanguinea]|nr:hypothetical protein FKP32DRAFT_259967 [Trametes sanguinea]
MQLFELVADIPVGWLSINAQWLLALVIKTIAIQRGSDQLFAFSGGTGGLSSTKPCPLGTAIRYPRVDPYHLTVSMSPTSTADQRSRCVLLLHGFRAESLGDTMSAGTSTCALQVVQDRRGDRPEPRGLSEAHKGLASHFLAPAMRSDVGVGVSCNKKGRYMETDYRGHTLILAKSDFAVRPVRQHGKPTSLLMRPEKSAA